MEVNYIAWLVLRVTVAWMYLYPIISLLKDRQGMISTTQLLFKWQPAFFAYASIAVMMLGAISILFGIYAQIGGLLLFVFTSGGTIIHYRLAGMAEMALSDPQQAGVAKLALVGHLTSAQKNFVLLAVAFFFILLGSGPCSLTTNLFFGG